MFVPVTYKRSRLNFEHKYAHGVLNTKAAYYVQRENSNKKDGHERMSVLAQLRERTVK